MNKVILIGRFTKDPELKSTQSTTVVCTFTLAINRRFNKPGEEKQADFPQVVTFGKTAEFVSNYFKKGSQIAIVGRIQTRTWDDAEGKKHYTTEVIADEAEFVESKKDNNGEKSFNPKSGDSISGLIPEKNEGGDGFYPVEEDELPF